MSYRRILASVGLVLLIASATRGSHLAAMSWQDSADRFLLGCSTFPSALTDADLRVRYGVDNISPARVPDYWGAEGDTTAGLALFTASPDRLEFAWRTLQGVRQLWLVTAETPGSRWHTAGGVAIGMDLLTVEKINERPFIVSGFEGDDYSSVQSWAGGKLAILDEADCRVRVSLMPRKGPDAEQFTTALLNQDLKGPFASNDAIVRKLNPHVVRLLIRR